MMCSSGLPEAQPGGRMRVRAIARVVGLALASLALPAACGEPGRPATKDAVLTVDGRPREVETRLYRPPPSFPLAFTTYLPPGVHVDVAPPGESSALTFVREGDGGVRGGAFVHLVVERPGISEQGARALLRAAAGRFRIPGAETELEPARIHRWAVEEYELRSRGTVRDRLGWMALGRQDGRWFVLTVQVPVSLAESFGPRADLIVEEWTWADGERLRRLTK